MNDSLPLNDSDVDSSVTSSVPVVAQSSVTKTPGQILREAREARGLSIEEVADVLRFSERQIAGIEQDNYQSLPGATLVRGFLRGYAKFLRIDPTPLLAQLATAVPTEMTDVRPPSNIGVAGDSMTNETMSPKLPLIILLVVVLVLAGAYWFIQSDQASISSSEQAAAAVAPIVVNPAPAVEVAPDSAATSDPANGGAVQASADGDATNPATSAAANVAVTAPLGMVVEFDDLSWIEVRDANQSVIFVGEYPKGTRQVIEGKSPFSLWIGRASVVRVSYRGQPVDIRSASREDVARLTVQ